MPAPTLKPTAALFSHSIWPRGLVALSSQPLQLTPDNVLQYGCPSWLGRYPARPSEQCPHLLDSYLSLSHLTRRTPPILSSPQLPLLVWCFTDSLLLHRCYHGLHRARATFS